jgi:hypothetical protein
MFSGLIVGKKFRSWSIIKLVRPFIDITVVPSRLPVINRCIRELQWNFSMWAPHFYGHPSERPIDFCWKWASVTRAPPTSEQWALFLGRTV